MQFSWRICAFFNGENRVLMKIYKWGFQPGVNDWIDRIRNTVYFQPKNRELPGDRHHLQRDSFTSKNVGKKIHEFSMI